MSRTLLALLVALPACLSRHGGPDESTGSTGPAGSTTADTSTGDGSSSTGGDGSSGFDSGSDSVGDSEANTSGTSDTTTGPGTTGPGTTGPAPFCGDGHVDPGEECDDGNADNDDSCSLICARSRTVFLTSLEFDGKEVGGLALADSVCRQLANKAGLANWQTFTAWLSDSKTSAGERIFHGKGLYIRPDGVIVARKAEQFGSGQLEAPIIVDETGTMVEGANVWTGTLPDGAAVPGSQHCNDWTSDSLQAMGHIGAANASDSYWTYIPIPEVNPTICAIHFRLYCMEGA